MKIIKGFVVIEQYVSNTVNTVAPLGELSTWCSTFAKDKGYYVSSDKPGYTLVTFKNVESDTGVKDPVAPIQVDEVFSVVGSLINYSLGRIRPHDPEDFKSNIQVEYNAKIRNIIFGPLVDNGTVQLPEWISWVSTQNADAEVKIWLSDLAFDNQYDEYDITVVPPVTNLDSLFGLYPSVKTSVQSRTDAEMMDIIQDAKNGLPETYIRLSQFDLVNTTNVQEKFSTNWSVIIYGRAGDNIDTIKDSIVDYVLQNSTKTRAQWEALLPDLFKRTEFVILPRWDKISIPNLTNAGVLYSSIMNPTECISFAKSHISFYGQDHIGNTVVILPYDYKAISLLSITGATNLPGKQSLIEIFPDYIPQSSMTNDFGRMQINTRDWVVKLGRLLQAAEVVTEYSSVPIGIRRLTRGGVLFVSMLHDNINYMVACRSNSFYNLA